MSHLFTQASPTKTYLLSSLALALALEVAPAVARTPVSTNATSKPSLRHYEEDTSHFWNGQRFDVPSTLLRSRGILINGLPPQAQQFD